MTEEVTGQEAAELPKNDYQITDAEPEVEVKETGTEGEEVAKEEVKPKKKNGFKKKIARLEAEVARLSQTQTGQNQPEVKKAESTGKPTPDKYPNWDEYLEALTDYKANEIVDKKLGERDNKAREQEQNKIVETKRQTFDQQKTELKKTIPDLDEVLSEYDDVTINPNLGAAIIDSDMAVQVAYEIAKNPEKFEKLNDPKMGLIAINKEIARIEARLESGNSEAAVTTKAPPPIKPVKPKATTSSGYSDEMSFEEYKARRASGKI